MNTQWWEESKQSNAGRIAARFFAIVLVLSVIIQTPALLLAPQTALAFTSTWDFSTSGDYSFDATKVKFASGSARAERTPDWWDTNYQYRKRITVTAGTTPVTTDDTLVLKTDVDALIGASKVQNEADPDDLRIVYWNGSNNTNIDREYFAAGLDETINSGTDQNDIRFKAQAAISASASDTGYYLYYGYASATAGPKNPANIYRYFEDFSTDVLTSGAWVEQNSARWSVTGGRLSHDSTNSANEYASYVGTTFSPASSWNFEVTGQRTSVNNTTSIAASNMSANDSPPTAGWRAGTFYNGSANDVEMWVTEGVKIGDGTGTVAALQNTDYRYTLRSQANATCGTNWQTISAWVEGVKYNQQNIGVTNCPVSLRAGVHQWNATGTFDNYKVWQQLGETVGVGTEETTYPNDDPTVTPSTPVSFTTLSSFSATVTGTGSAQFILSNDGGSTWKYYDGAAWSTSNASFAQSSTAAQINTNIGTFPLGSGSLLFRAFLHSNGTQTVLLDTVVINGSVKPVAPTPATPSDGAAVSSTTPSFTMSTTDSDSDSVKYKLQIDTVNTFDSGNLQTFDQTSSQTGWSGQNAAGNTAYASGATATFTVSAALAAGTTYYWRVAANDTAGSNTFSDYSTIRSFTTPVALSTPVPTATAVNARSMRITWTTTAAGNSVVQYGLTSSYGTTVSDSASTTSHSVLLSDLTPATEYNYRVSTTVGSETATSSNATFTTPAITPTLLEPTEDAVFTTAQSIKVIGLAISGQTVNVFVDGTLDGSTKAATTTTGVGSFAYTLAHELSAGSHAITVTGTTSDVDSVASAARTIVVTLPAIPPTVLDPIVTDGTNPTIVVRGLAPSGSTVQVFLDGKLVKTVTAKNTSTGVGSFGATLSIKGLKVGRHTVTVVGIGDDDRPSKSRTAATFTVAKNGIVQTRFTGKARSVVAGGQSLWQLAKQFYGDGKKFTKIVEANKDRFPSLKTNPSLIRPGWQLVIPK